MLRKINFVTNEQKLKEMAYGDTVYAWLLLHSHYDPDEEHNYIYKNEFTYEMIGKDIGRTRQTISKRFKELLAQSLENKDGVRKDLIYECGKKYNLPCFRDFQQLDKDTVLNLFRLCGQSRREELLKTYAWLLKKFEKGEKNISFNDIILTFGHSKGNEQTYNRYKDILTTLQGAGLIKFRTDVARTQGKYGKTLYVYQVNKKASQEWLDKNKEDNNE